LEKYALTKPLPPYKRNDQRWKNFADAEGRERNQSAKEGRWKRLISRLSKARKLSRAYDSKKLFGQKIEDIANRYFNNKVKDLLLIFENH
jgi:hypothetical protein